MLSDKAKKKLSDSERRSEENPFDEIDETSGGGSFVCPHTEERGNFRSPPSAINPRASPRTHFNNRIAPTFGAPPPQWQSSPFIELSNSSQSGALEAENLSDGFFSPSNPNPTPNPKADFSDGFFSPSGAVSFNAAASLELEYAHDSEHAVCAPDAAAREASVA